MGQIHPHPTITEVRPGDHLCCLCENPEQRRAAITPFMGQGLQQGQKVLCLVNESEADRVVDDLRAGGLDAESPLASGQFGILAFAGGDSQGGEPARIIQCLQAEVDHAIAVGYPNVRATVEMTAVLHDLDGERLLEFEGMLDTFVCDNACAVLCLYDQRQIKPAILLNGLRAHPIVVAGEKLRDNFFNMSPLNSLTDDAASQILCRCLANLVGCEEAETVLDESAERFRTVADFAYDWEYWVGPEGEYVYVSPSCRRITGYRADEFVSDPDLLMRITHPDDLAGLREHLASVPGVDESVPMEFRITTRDGELRWIEHLCQPVYGPDGRCLGRRASNRDITLRKQTEQELWQQQFYFQQLFESSPEAILMVDAQNRVLRINKAFEKLFQYSVGELQEDDLNDFIVPAGCAEEASALTREGLQGNVVQKETVRRRKDGSLVPVEVLGYPILMHDKPAGAYVVYRDIAARKQAEEALRSSLQTSADIIKAIPSGLFIYRYEEPDRLVLIDANPAAEALTGITAEQWVGKEFNEIWPAARQSGITDAYLEVMRTGRILDTEDVHYKDERIEGVFRAHIFRMPGQRLGVAFENITERKRGEAEKARLHEQLHQARKMEAIGQLAGGVAHDFNNLLTAILGNAELIKGKLPEDSEAQAALEMIAQAAEHATGVTRSLLTFSRNVPAEKKPVDLADVVKEAHRMLRRTLPASIDLVVDVDRDPPMWANADSTQLQQVILNLAVNARDAMPDGGTLRIALTPDSDADQAEPRQSAGAQAPYARLSVSDTGAGMAPDVRSRLFEPFFTTKARGQGTGLGLAIIHGIVEDHGGRIEVASELGVGSNFVITLPGIQPETTPGRAEPAPVVPRGRGETVLLAEDNQFVREVMVQSLRSLGYEILQAADGSALIETCLRHRGDVRLLIVDADLPKRQGLDSLRVLRADGIKEPAVVITGSVDASIEDQLDSNTVLLRKPFPLSELGNVVSSLLRTHP